MSSTYTNDSEVYKTNFDDTLFDSIESLVNIIIDLLAVDTLNNSCLVNSSKIDERDPCNWVSFLNAIGKSQLEASQKNPHLFNKFNPHVSSGFTYVSALEKTRPYSRVIPLFSFIGRV